MNDRGKKEEGEREKKDSRTGVQIASQTGGTVSAVGKGIHVRDHAHKRLLHRGPPDDVVGVQVVDAGCSCVCVCA